MLHSGRLYLVRMPTADAGTSAMLTELLRCIKSRGGVRVDLSSSGVHWGNNFRLVMAQYALALGVRKALYLDCDTVVQSTVSALFDADDRAPLVVANRTSSSRDLGFSYGTYGRDEAMAERRRVWGFDDVRLQSFNAGVMMLNLRRWCEEGMTQRVVRVAQYHADVQPLFQMSGNQPLLELAGARHTYRVHPSWNCRVRGHPRPGCRISHIVSAPATWSRQPIVRTFHGVINASELFAMLPLLNATPRSPLPQHEHRRGATGTAVRS